MATQTLKEEIAEWILESDYEALLKTWKNIKDSQTPADWLFSLYAEDRDSLQKGLRDYDNSDVLTEETFWSDL